MSNGMVMALEWTPDIEMTPALAQRLIESQFPWLAPVQAEALGAGWDNTAFLVNGVTVFRFPRREFAVEFLESEARVMPLLAPRLPLPVPCPRYIGKPAESFPWPFLGCRMLPGRTACRAMLKEGQRTALAAPLGLFLSALHRIPPDTVQAGPDTIARLALARRISRARENLEQGASRGLVGDTRPLTAILDTAPLSYTPRADTLVHGDLYARHLLVGPHEEICGVIDWGDAHRGDPAIDLAIAYTFLPPAARQLFFDAYGPVEEITLAVAHLRALWHTLTLLIYSHETGDQELLREAQTAVGYLS